MSKFSTEQEEVEYLLSQATYPAVKELLREHLATLAHISSIQKDFPGALELEDDEHAPDTTDKVDPNENSGRNTVPLTSPAAPSIPAVVSKKCYIPISSFSWDQAGIDKPLVTIYVDILNVGTIPIENREQQISCDFTVDSFDLRVEDLNGKNYRLVQDNLDKDIEPSKCKYVVKANKIVIKLHKAVDTTMGSGLGQKYENWTVLACKKTKEQKIAAKKKKANNPMDSLQDMMKDMYDEGDDKMKSIIGEAMAKSRGGGLGNM